MKIDRRSFVKVGLSGAAAGVVAPAFRWSFLTRAIQAAQIGGSTPKKLMVIFLRGGNDGVNTCIPYGDSSYNPSTRPNIYIPENQALDLGNGFARLHPALAELYEVHQAGHLATLHRCAYESQSRSHFDSQHYWENAIPGSELEEGWLYRYVNEHIDTQANPLAAASLSNQLMLMFKGQNVLPHIPDVATYNFGPPGSAAAAKLLGTQSQPNGSRGSGILGWYGQPQNGAGYDILVKNTGLALGTSIQALQAAGVDPASYVPENGAVYPSPDNPQGFNGQGFEYFARLRDAAALLKLTEMQVVGLEYGGFDTHSSQGGVNGAHANLLRVIGYGTRSIWRDLQSIWDDLLVLTVSEFGRTSAQNGSFGTDHGEASCMFAAGGAIKGGVYNCDASTWSNGDMFSTPNGRYVTHLTDFRGILGEVLVRHFGLKTSDLEGVIPGYSSHAGDPKFNFLDFLPV